MRHFLDRPAGWTPPRLADIYDETSFWSARFGALLFEFLEIRRGIRGLDIGCGTGFPLIELAHLHGASSHFTGIDIRTDALARAPEARGTRADQRGYRRGRCRLDAVPRRPLRSDRIEHRREQFR